MARLRREVADMARLRMEVADMARRRMEVADMARRRREELTQRCGGESVRRLRIGCRRRERCRYVTAEGGGKRRHCQMRVDGERNNCERLILKRLIQLESLRLGQP